MMQTFLAADRSGVSCMTRAQCSRTIAQCLNLEHEFHHAASKLCILGFQTLKQSLIVRTPLINPLRFQNSTLADLNFEDVFIRTVSPWPNSSRASCRLSAFIMNHPHFPLFPNHGLGRPSLPEAPIAEVTRKQTRVGGAEYERNHPTSTAHAVPMCNHPLAPPVRSRCDGDHKNPLFCRVLQKMLRLHDPPLPSLDYLVGASEQGLAAPKVQP